MKPLTEVTNDEIRQADWINAIDPESGHCETLWGFDDNPIGKNQQTSILDVEVARRDHISLMKLIDRIEAVRGRLPPRIQVARENMQIASSLRQPAYSDLDVHIADYFLG